MITDVKKMAETIKKAFYIASSGRPGPVVVDIPKDITEQKCKFEYPNEVNIRSYQPYTDIEDNKINHRLNFYMIEKGSLKEIF